MKGQPLHFEGKRRHGFGASEPVAHAEPRIEVEARVVGDPETSGDVDEAVYAGPAELECDADGGV